MEPLKTSDQPLLLTHLPLIRSIVFKRIKGRPSLLALRDDLLQEAVIGAIDAINRHDPHSGACLSTYIGIRVHGHLTDYIRQQIPLPRSAQHSARDLLRHTTQAEQALGHTCSLNQIAKQTGTTPARLREGVQAIAGQRLVSFCPEGVPAGDGKEEAAHAISATDVEEEVYLQQKRALVHQHIRNFDRRHRCCLQGTLLEGKDFNQIAKEQGCCASRVWQLNTGAAAKIQQRLRAQVAIMD